MPFYGWSYSNTHFVPFWADIFSLLKNTYEVTYRNKHFFSSVISAALEFLMLKGTELYYDKCYRFMKHIVN